MVIFILLKEVLILWIQIFSKSKDTSRMNLHTLSWNNPDGEPNKALKSDKFVVVNEF